MTPEPDPDPRVLAVKLDGLEHTVRAFGPSVTRVAELGANVEGLADDLRELADTHRQFRMETRESLERNGRECRDGLERVAEEFRQGIKDLRTEIRQDRSEARNRSFYLAGPIALAAIALVAKIVFGLDVHL